MMSARIRKEDEALREVDNVYGMNFSIVMVFADLTEFTASTNFTNNDNGELILTTGETTGEGTSLTYEQDTEITQFVLKVKGQDLDSSTIEVSLNLGSTYTTATADTLYTKIGADTGSDVVVRITLTSDTENPNPKISTLAVLLK